MAGQALVVARPRHDRRVGGRSDFALFLSRVAAIVERHSVAFLPTLGQVTSPRRSRFPSGLHAGRQTQIITRPVREVHSRHGVSSHNKPTLLVTLCSLW